MPPRKTYQTIEISQPGAIEAFEEVLAQLISEPIDGRIAQGDDGDGAVGRDHDGQELAHKRGCRDRADGRRTVAHHPGDPGENVMGSLFASRGADSVETIDRQHLSEATGEAARLDGALGHARECDRRGRVVQERMGQPLTPATKQAYLCVPRQFFRDGQEWGWFPRRFDPGRALATPRSIKAMIGPRPRVIDDAAWAKLLWAGLHLETADVPASRGTRFYSVEFIRALALTWPFGRSRRTDIASPRPVLPLSAERTRFGDQ